MSAYWPEFLKVAIAHFLAVVSPGPDFAIVLRQSLTHGRRAAVWTAIGVGTAICLHVTYSLLGIGVLMRSSPTAFTVLKFAGAAYLAGIGIHALRTPPRGAAGPPGAETQRKSARSFGTQSPRGAWTAGFVTNATNPKATVFFVALFAAVISPGTPKLVQAGYGAWISVMTAAWFSFVAYVFTRENIRRAFLKRGHWIDRALGVLFIVLAVSLAIASV